MNNSPTATPQEYFPSWYRLDYKKRIPKAKTLTEKEMTLISTVLRFYELTADDISRNRIIRKPAECRSMIWLLLSEVYNTRLWDMADYFRMSEKAISSNRWHTKKLVTVNGRAKDNYNAILKLI